MRSFAEPDPAEILTMGDMGAESLATRAAAPKDLRRPAAGWHNPLPREGEQEVHGEEIDDRVGEPPPGYRTQSEDTSYRIERMLFERWREMEPHEKAAIVTSLARATHQLARIGLAERWPDADEREIDLRLAGFHLGREWIVRMTGFDPEAKRG